MNQSMTTVNGFQVNSDFYRFINEEVLPKTELEEDKFWQDFIQLFKDLAPRNRELLDVRDQLQQKIDDWHKANRDKPFDSAAYKTFLQEIGYLREEGEDFSIDTINVDDEIATVAGPQLVVPVKNARFALNAANARWGSLYDALYGSDVIPHNNGLKPCANGKYNIARGRRVIAHAKEFLDRVFPLKYGCSHRNVKNYVVYFQNLMAIMADGSTAGLRNPCQYVGCNGSKDAPDSILVKNNELHVEIQIDSSSKRGSEDLAGVEDIRVEAAVSTIMDCEDSVATVDTEDKLEVYRNWMGLMMGDLVETFQKNGETIKRRLNRDRMFTHKNGNAYRCHGRSLLLVRNVGHLTTIDTLLDEDGNPIPEGMMDAVVTSLIGTLDLNRASGKPIQNSRQGSIYIVKPKMHGPDEVAFSDELFARVEDMLELPRNTLKMGIMDEERRTTLNLKECIRAAKSRVVFINTGFLDRTGDEIHTSMEAGPFLPKAEIKAQPWIKAYEDWNVDIGLECGLQGRAQIGKGMWAMPDEMAAMMEQKGDHPRAGANTAWVPSPTAAVLHAMHYHDVDVYHVQNELKERERANIDDLLTIPLLEDKSSLSQEDVERELENNLQGILGYVVRWINQGVGCSKVPDINNMGLMEDRATLRISSQHIANWLHHGICTEEQVMSIMKRMAEVVDKQNQGAAGYISMTPAIDSSAAFEAARQLVFEGRAQPNGYTELLLHANRRALKEHRETEAA